MDDLDTARNKPGSAQQIIADLNWLGLDFDDQIIYQSERTGLYQLAFEELQSNGRLFPCRCSRKDIQESLSAPDNRFKTVAYPGNCRPDACPVDLDQQDALAWRFLVADGESVFTDMVYPAQRANLRKYPGDFVVKRKDGVFAYQLASVVDDVLLGVTDVVRGADLLDSTPRQLALFEAMNSPSPRFWHVPLMHDHGGEKLSKRDGADSLDRLRGEGTKAASVVAMLGASLGLIAADQQISCNELLQELTLNQLQQALKTARASA